MLDVFARPSVSKALAPVGARLARAGISPDAITVVGAVGAVAAAVGFFGRGSFFLGALVIGFFVVLDILDGAVARARGQSSKFGAVLDSTSDRVVDAAIFGALLWWFSGSGSSDALALAALLCLIFGMITPYVRARAEGLDMTCRVGFAERAERLLIVLVGAGLDGLGLPYVLAIALWFLTVASAVTVIQRLVEVRRQCSPINRAS